MDISPAENPFELFREWLAAAEKTEPCDPGAMALATVGQNGKPSVRMVLLKGLNDRGFHFYTNMESRKGVELTANPDVALCFHWKSQERQIRVEGRVEKLPGDVTDVYFKTRHPLSRLAAWASRQSRPLATRKELEDRVEEYKKKFPGEDVPRPDYWMGYCVVPEVIEFWQAGEGRLHDRFVFAKKDNGWVMTRLNP